MANWDMATPFEVSINPQDIVHSRPPQYTLGHERVAQVILSGPARRLALDFRLGDLQRRRDMMKPMRWAVALLGGVLVVAISARADAQAKEKVYRSVAPGQIENALNDLN